MVYFWFSFEMPKPHAVSFGLESYEWIPSGQHQSDFIILNWNGRSDLVEQFRQMKCSLVEQFCKIKSTLGELFYQKNRKIAPKLR